MSINKFITNLDLARQAEIMSGETAVFQGGIQLGLPFSGFPSGVDTSTIVSLGVQEIEYTAFSGGSGTTLFDVVNPSSPYYSVSAVTISASPYTIIDVNTITETVSATTYPTIMTFTALSGDCCSTPISVSFTPPIIQELYDRGLYDGLFNGLGQATIGTTYIDESFYNVGSVFSGANLDMEIIEYGVHGSNPSWVTGTTSGTVIEYSALTQYWSNPIYENLTSGLTLPITPISAETQTSDYVWTLTDSTIIDDNLIGLQYTGYNVTYSFDNVIDDPATQTYIIGGVTSTLEYFSAGTLDYKNSIEWLKVRGNATIDERLTTDRLTIHTLGTGSPVTMLAVDVNGNVVGGTGGTTDDTGAFTSTTANNTIIPTNAAGNTNDSDYASILGGQNNTISGTSTSSAIVGGENNVVKNVSDYSIIAGGEDNTISGHTHSFIIGGSGNTINFSAFYGDGEGIIGSTNTIIEGSKNTLINSSVDSGIYGGQLSSIQSSYESNIYNDMTAGGENYSNTIIGSRLSLISGTTGGSAFRFNSLISADNGNIYDSTNTTIIAGNGDIHNTIVGGIFGGRGTISASTLQSYSVIVGARNSELYDSSTSGIIVGNAHTLTDSGSSGIFGGEGNVINNSDKSSIIGGNNNILINSDRTLILGGESNTGSTHFDSLLSGRNNEMTYEGLYNILLGGLDNVMGTPLGGITAPTSASSILGGYRNLIYENVFDSSILGGRDNTIEKFVRSSSIIGGSGNTNTHDRSVILGGLGITTTANDTVYMNNLSVQNTNGIFYSNVNGTTENSCVLSGGSNTLSFLESRTIDNSSVRFGVRGASMSPFIFDEYGKVNDSFLYSSINNNGLNIISAPGISGTEDYIRFYVGQNAELANTPDIHIQGTGSTRGYVGIGTETPTEKLDVNGNTIVSGTLNIGTLGGGSSVNNLGIDASGNVVSGNTGSFLAAKAPEVIVTHSLTAKGIPDGQVISGYTDIRYNNTDISGTLTTPFGTFDNTTGIFTTNTDCVLNIQAFIHLKANTASTTAWETGATPTQIGIGICPNNATDIFVGDFITILPSVSRGLDVTTGITQRVLSGTTFRIKILNQTSRAYPGPGVVSGDYMRFSITRVD
jgi:hypothetical protein